MSCLEDLPDLAILEIFGYLKSTEIILSFFDLSERINNLLIEKHYFEDVCHLPLKIFNYMCNDIFPKMGRDMFSLKLSDQISCGQLEIMKQHHFCELLPNVTSLQLYVVNVHSLKYYFDIYLAQLHCLTIEYDGTKVPRVLGDSLFNKKTHLNSCILIGNVGIHFRHNEIQKCFIQNLTLRLDTIIDLLLLFDNLPVLKRLNVKFNQKSLDYNDRNIRIIDTYDYSSLQIKLPHLHDFTLKTNYNLTYEIFEMIIKNLKYLKRLHLSYTNYAEHGITESCLRNTLSHLKNLTELNLLLRIIYFSIDYDKLKSNDDDKWKFYFSINETQKEYVLYTMPYFNSTFSMSFDMLLNTPNSHIFYSVKKLNLSNHNEQISFSQIAHILNKKFPNLTCLTFGYVLKLSDSGLLSNIKLNKVMNVDFIHNTKYFQQFILLLPNLKELKVSYSCLVKCNGLEQIFNKIRRLELFNYEFITLITVLSHFLSLECLSLHLDKVDNHMEKEEKYRILYQIVDGMKTLYSLKISSNYQEFLYYLYKMFSINSHMIVNLYDQTLSIWK
ncbi:unnamed protein product [Didymodactylos carnosus]|uniref:F-box domain-containing protein n=1 Tax=Didymodactylos carnosus TaxID=1234261 RepID=A0A813NWW4_9BILA|nr:unnamed protein product [Didymodactylos carnosus]CAF3520269.1 unnamed protein product [Didymodactylos carnosus]